MDKWLMLLASLTGAAAAPQDVLATVKSGADVGITNLNLTGSLWMLGQCVTPACAPRTLSVLSFLVQI